MTDAQKIQAALDASVSYRAQLTRDGARSDMVSAIDDRIRRFQLKLAKVS